MGYILFGLWISWFGYWQYYSNKAKKPKFKAMSNSLFYLLPLYISYLLLSIPIVIIMTPMTITGIIITIAGLSLASLARYTLGRNWSAGLTIQQNHRLITTGVYHFTKHPIYIGMIIAFIGTTLFQGSLSAIIATIIGTVTLCYKAIIEEKQLAIAFPVKYSAYCKYRYNIFEKTVNEHYDI